MSKTEIVLIQLTSQDSIDPFRIKKTIDSLNPWLDEGTLDNTLKLVVLNINTETHLLQDLVQNTFKNGEVLWGIPLEWLDTANTSCDYIQEGSPLVKVPFIRSRILGSVRDFFRSTPIRTLNDFDTSIFEHNTHGIFNVSGRTERMYMQAHYQEQLKSAPDPGWWNVSEVKYLCVMPGVTFPSTESVRQAFLSINDGLTLFPVPLFNTPNSRNIGDIYRTEKTSLEHMSQLYWSQNLAVKRVKEFGDNRDENYVYTSFACIGNVIKVKEYNFALYFNAPRFTDICDPLLFKILYSAIDSTKIERSIPMQFEPSENESFHLEIHDDFYKETEKETA